MGCQVLEHTGPESTDADVVLHGDYERVRRRPFGKTDIHWLDPTGVHDRARDAGLRERRCGLGSRLDRLAGRQEQHVVTPVEHVPFAEGHARCW